MKQWVLLAMFMVMAAMIGAVILYRPAHGHSWYELSCCSENDCKPVPDDAVQYKSDGVYVDGYGVMSYQDPRLRWSRDNQHHVCASGTKLRCLYRRPSGV